MEVLTPSSLFHLFSINLLGLLLPLSFLLLARLSSALYFVAPPPLPPLLLSLVLYVNSPLLCILVAFVIVSALLHSLTGKSALSTRLPDPVSQPRLYTAWIFLCTFQVCVGVGIEGSLSTGLNDEAAASSVEGGLWSRLLFFLGLHEAVMHWTRTVVKPVVDDTVFGESRKERWFEMVGTTVTLGGLWWWRMRNEAEALAVVPMRKWLASAELSPMDISGWCLYYITVAIGIAKIVKSIAWFGSILFSKKHSKCFGEVAVEDKV